MQECWNIRWKLASTQLHSSREEIYSRSITRLPTDRGVPNSPSRDYGMLVISGYACCQGREMCVTPIVLMLFSKPELKLQYQGMQHVFDM